MKRILIIALLLVASCTTKTMELNVKQPTQADKDLAEQIWIKNQQKIIK